MKNEVSLHTRREFLRRTVLGSSLAWTVPVFLADTFAVLQAEAADKEEDGRHPDKRGDDLPCYEESRK